jgi:neutral ceramidase
MKPTFIRFVCVSAVAVLVLSATISMAQTGNLRAGAAKVDITPPSSMFPITDGNTKYGSVHDPIFARALVLDNGATKVAFISVDATQLLYGDEMAKAVTDELKIPAANLILNGTHDHSVPHTVAAMGSYKKDIPVKKAPMFDIAMKGIVEAARQANANLQPARIGFGTGKAYVNANRDIVVDGIPRMTYNPERVSDKTVAVMLLTKPSGEPIAVYSNYPCHPIVTFGISTKDGMREISADLAGAANNYVEDHFKGATAIWTMGAAGDQQPEYMARSGQNWDEGTAGYALLDVESRRLGEEIVRVAKSIQNTTGKAVLWGAQTSVSCPGRKRATEPGAEAAGRGAGSAGRGAGTPVKMVDGDPVTVPLALIMVNDIAIPGIAAEPFTGIGMHVKQDSLFDRTFVVTLLFNGMGYLPTDEAYTLPAQASVSNSLKPGCIEPAIVDAIVKMERSYLPVWQAAQK